MSAIISINLDSFIYAIRQAFDARIKKNGQFESHLKYTPFLDNTWQKPEKEVDIPSLKTPLHAILQHHWTVIPHYQRHDSVNLENISWFALSIATLFADIEHLCKETLGHGLPLKQEQTDDAKALWTLITDAVKDVFKDYANLFELYAEWKYNPHIEKKEPVDWNVRPPCGLLYKTEFKALFDELRNARFGNRQQQRTSNTSQSRHHKDGSEHRKHAEADASKASHTNQKSHHQRKTSDMREHKKPHKPKKLFDDGGTALKAALEDCKKAIETLNNDSNMHELSLPPQNSFLRRHQHTFITDAGFDTDSRGDGDQRHVCVIKKSINQL